jgi:hypothetical protein
MALTKQVYLKQKQWFKKNNLEFIRGVKCRTYVNTHLVLKITIANRLYYLYFNKETKKLEKTGKEKHKLFKYIIKDNPSEFVDLFLRI